MKSEKRKIEHAVKTAHTGAYSSGVLCDGWLYVSGHASVDLETGDVKEGTIGEETFETLRLIEQLIVRAGGDRNDIVKCSVHLDEISEFDRFDQAYGQFFEGCTMPARTTVGSQLPGIKVEIDAVAHIPDSLRRKGV